MKTKLIQKLTQNTPYTDQELDWLLTHIGDPDPQVRDQLVYASLAHALIDGLISTKQAHWLFTETQTRGLQTLALDPSLDNSRAGSLTRSFTSLLHALLLYVDGLDGHALHDCLTPDQRIDLFDLILTYLPRETDFRGYQEPVGWVHALAHGADYLQVASCHPHFPKEKLSKVLDLIASLIQTIPQVLTAGEPGRLAAVLLANLSLGRLDQDQLVTWLPQLTVDGDDHLSYAKQLNCQALLSQLYLQLDKDGELSPPLKQGLLNHPHLFI